MPGASLNLDIDSEIDQQPRFTPEQRLICAILRRAILDLSINPKLKEGYSSVAGTNPSAARREARSWFLTIELSDTGYFPDWSFRWCCDRLGYNADRIITRLVERGIIRRLELN